jgi:hypothetical protein
VPPEATKLCALPLRPKLGSGLQLGVRELSNFNYEPSVQVRSKHCRAASCWDLEWSYQRDGGVQSKLHTWRSELGFWHSEPVWRSFWRWGWWGLNADLKAQGFNFFRCIFTFAELPPIILVHDWGLNRSRRVVRCMVVAALSYLRINWWRTCFIDEKIAEHKWLHIVFLQMFHIRCSRDHLSNLGLQMIGSFFLTPYYMKGAFLFRCQLAFGRIFCH